MTPAAVTAGKPVPTGQTQAAEGERERECCGLQSWCDAPRPLVPRGQTLNTFHLKAGSSIKACCVPELLPAGIKGTRTRSPRAADDGEHPGPHGQQPQAEFLHATLGLFHAQVLEVQSPTVDSQHG